MIKSACTAVNVPKHIECKICLDSWTNPVQLLKCGHIFCSSCAPQSTKRCAICNSIVTGFAAPSDGITEASMNVPVLCTSCGWRGSRKASLTHQCDPSQTHSPYMTLPPMTDAQWMAFALQRRNGSETGVVMGTVAPDALPVSSAVSNDAEHGISLWPK